MERLPRHNTIFLQGVLYHQSVLLVSVVQLDKISSERFIHSMNLDKMFINYPPSKNGLIVSFDGHESAQHSRPRLMTAYYSLGVVMTWTRTHRSAMVLQNLLSMTQTGIFAYLTFCNHIFIHILQRNDYDKMKQSNVEKVREY